jgi:hypothetical protein
MAQASLSVAPRGASSVVVEVAEQVAGFSAVVQVVLVVVHALGDQALVAQGGADLGDGPAQGLGGLLAGLFQGLLAGPGGFQVERQARGLGLRLGLGLGVEQARIARRGVRRRSRRSRRRGGRKRGQARGALGRDLLLQLADGALQAARGQFEGVPFARGHRHRPTVMQRNI